MKLFIYTAVTNNKQPSWKAPCFDLGLKGVNFF